MFTSSFFHNLNVFFIHVWGKQGVEPPAPDLKTLSEIYVDPSATSPPELLHLFVCSLRAFHCFKGVTRI